MICNNIFFRLNFLRLRKRLQQKEKKKYIFILRASTPFLTLLPNIFFSVFLLFA